MSGLYSDTHPKIEQMQIEFILRMPAWRKMGMVDGLNEAVKNLARKVYGEMNLYQDWFYRDFP